ncbi:LOW QUALITY PROTEIN: hypothetical protein CFOL_v3_00453, partial [Cephalotus follicularis]
MHASITAESKTFMVKTLNDQHRCVKFIAQEKNTSSSIDKQLCNELWADPDIFYEFIYQKLNVQFGVTSQSKQLYKARNKGRGVNEGKDGLSFHKLMKNKACTGPHAFKRVFVCYEAMKTGFFEGCRPFIGLDGCHLKWPFGGLLLGAISV